MRVRKRVVAGIEQLAQKLAVDHSTGTSELRNRSGKSDGGTPAEQR
jgi:hypothetical protein